MNKINKYFRLKSYDKTLKMFLVILCFSLTFFSCNEDEFLKTEPVDFYSPENSFITNADYEAAVMNLYNEVRNEFFTSDSRNSFPSAANAATDICYQHKDIG